MATQIPPLSKWVHKIRDIAKPGDEFEFRIRSLTDKGLEQDTWICLLKTFKDEYPEDVTTQASETYIFANNIRRTIYADGRSDEWVKKIEKERFIQKIAQLGISVKFALSSEDTIDPPKNPGKPQIIRKRRRVSINIPTTGIRLDLTVVQDINNGQLGDREYEAEVEFIGHGGTGGVPDIKQINSVLKNTLSRVKFCSDMFIEVSPDEHKSIKNDIYNILTVHNRTPTFNKAIPFKRENARVVANAGYNVTNKLDGTRNFLVFIEYGVFLVSFNFKKIIRVYPYTYSGLIGTIVDGELFVKNGVTSFWAFDILSYAGNIIMYGETGETGREIYTHPYRINLLNEIHKFLPENSSISKLFNVKKFVSSIAEIWTYMDEHYDKEDNDGIIFTPINVSYVDSDCGGGVARNKFCIFKYKEPKDITIDFAVIAVSPGANRGEYKLYVLDDKKRQNMLFTGTIQYPFNGQQSFEFTEFPNFKSGDIIEMKWDGKRFTPYRARTDRKEPNRAFVAIDNWLELHNPISKDDLSLLIQNARSPSGPSGPSEFSEHDVEKTKFRESEKVDLTPMRKYHNTVKRQLIESVCVKDDVILDIGSGRGGDLSKYKKCEPSALYMIDPNEENLNELKSRLNTTFKSLKPVVKILQAYGQDTEKIVKLMKNKEADIVSQFFSLTFFFQSDDLLDQLVDTIDETLKYGGVYIGTVMDGHKVSNLINSINRGDTWSNNAFSIQKLYEGEYTKGTDYAIKITLTDTIVGTQEEWLVDFNLFAEKLMQRGIILDDTSYLTGTKFASPDLDVLSSLYRSFVFKRAEEEEAEEESDEEEEEQEESEEEEKWEHAFKPPPQKSQISQKARQNITGIRMSSIDVGKNVKMLKEFNKILKNLHEELIPMRTGTVGEGSCLFHALLTATDKAYNKATPKEKMKIAKGYRENLAETLTLDAFMSNGSLAVFKISEKFVALLESSKDKGIKDFAYNISAQFTKIFTKIWDELTSIQDVKDKMTAYLSKHFNSKQIKTIYGILDQSITYAYEKYKKTMADCSYWAGDEELEYLARSSGYNLIILDAVTKRVYNYYIIPSNTKYVVILWLGAHYESVGIYNSTTKKIQREFEDDDQFIAILMQQKIE